MYVLFKGKTMLTKAVSRKIGSRDKRFDDDGLCNVVVSAKLYMRRILGKPSKFNSISI